MKLLLACVELYMLFSPVFTVLLGPTSNLEDLTGRYTRRTENGIHLPILRTNSQNSKQKRRGLQGIIGLGDNLDTVYNVLVTVGGTAMPVVLDTGSSDLWVASQSCTTGCDGIRTSPYPQETFNYSGLDARLFYGDSTSGTYAFGPIGTDTVAVAGLTLSKQYFAAVNNTNTTIADTESTGVFGLGFPINSAIFSALLAEQQPNVNTKGEQGELPKETPRYFTQYGTLDKHRTTFPDFSASLTNYLSSPSATDKILASFLTLGPLVARLASANSLSEPMFSVTLQRDTVEIGGNAGMLSLGELPPNVKNDSLTWVPLRAYSPDQGGLEAPSTSPDETYPVTWEVFLDDVFLDGERLPRSQFSPPDIQLSALVDTGNSILRGPSDVVDLIYGKLGQTFPCNEPHTLSFSIGGQLFPVDPRDLVEQAYDNDTSTCVPRLASTNAPSIRGFLYSWSLGDPFLKSVLSAYYYGNLSYPSRDPPRMGFLSTVPSDAGERLKADVNESKGQNFPSRIESAPTGEPTNLSIGPSGVAQVVATSSPIRSSSISLCSVRPRWKAILGLNILIAVLSSKYSGVWG